ncbi:ribonuclease III [Myroides odoratimimus]|uniref:Ribonuclease 3 n=2 Tax=Myroides odoratimimus TaxID=76832 RepID=A0A0U2XQ58_9FLAO|nr:MULTISPECIES: ribonuclease III [Myroides]AJA68167.1 ribonuclease III, bacterial [Myroides sp. A21]ALU25473.1 ribonuclease III [Myroides odoratimimus]EHO06832.1 ribonuclease III [Myroides odoratimimus CCUG 10230]MDM1035491.1 ribonuclease III [Myroides odoratimimus]MDM1065731.1 ribonuclease III [Myroides odoratimimus]
MKKLLNRIFNNSRSFNNEDGNFCRKVTEIVGVKPVELSYYKIAFTHRSMNRCDEEGHPVNYERLEFLGDAMLGSVIASYLFIEVPSGDEGYLTKMRSKIVSRENLNQLGKDLKLISHVESKMGNQQFGENIHGNLLEAIIGAIYLDRGYPACEKFIHEQLLSKVSDIQELETKITSYKSLLIEWCQKRKHTFKYDTFEEDTAEELKYFGVRLFIDDKLVAKARATSKKKAEEKASQRAYFAFQEQIKQ